MARNVSSIVREAFQAVAPYTPSVETIPVRDIISQSPEASNPGCSNHPRWRSVYVEDIPGAGNS